MSFTISLLGLELDNYTESVSKRLDQVLHITRAVLVIENYRYNISPTAAEIPKIVWLHLPPASDPFGPYVNLPQKVCVCLLSERNSQATLDLKLSPGEMVSFSTSGSHLGTVHLTGYYTPK